MRLNDLERDMLAGSMGEPRHWALEQQIRVGRFFDAEDFIEVAQVHLMADTESLGESGVQFLEQLAAAAESQRRVRVPTITDPLGIDFAAYKRLHQTEAMAGLERRAIQAFKALGIMMTGTCINYQTIIPPVLGEHLAFGDTGSNTSRQVSAIGAPSGGLSAASCSPTGRYRWSRASPARRHRTSSSISVRPSQALEPLRCSIWSV
jgi:predicted aconitase